VTFDSDRCCTPAPETLEIGRGSGGGATVSVVTTDKWRAGGRARTLSDERIEQRGRSLQRHTALTAAAYRASNLRRATIANGLYARALRAWAGCDEDT
jgi:hypothetical protein